MKPRVVLIIQARMGSTRLPGKVIKPILGQPMLIRQIERLRRCQNVDQQVVATTNDRADDTLASLVTPVPDVDVFRGSTDDVLDRYFGAATSTGADLVVRVTSDCPLIEPSVVDRCIETMLTHFGKVAYVSNCCQRTYPRGLDTEVIDYPALATAHQHAADAAEREHVTPFIWRRPTRFRLMDVLDAEDNSHLRWTVDTPADLELVERIYEELYPNNPSFDYRDVLDLVAGQPELQNINSHIEQKPYEA